MPEEKAPEQTSKPAQKPKPNESPISGPEDQMSILDLEILSEVAKAFRKKAYRWKEAKQKAARHGIHSVDELDPDKSWVVKDDNDVSYRRIDGYDLCSYFLDALGICDSKIRILKERQQQNPDQKLEPSNWRVIYSARHSIIEHIEFVRKALDYVASDLPIGKDHHFRTMPQVLFANSQQLQNPTTAPYEPVPAPEEWEQITPVHLHGRVRAIRKDYDKVFEQCIRVGRELCYSALHPGAVDVATLEPQHVFFSEYRRVMSAPALERFAKALASDQPPSIFKAYLDLSREGLKIATANCFNLLLDIGNKHAQSLSNHPIDWAKQQLSSLINGEGHRVREWVIRVCDHVDFDDESEVWTIWRAPKLIHMKPSGNTPYAADTAWERENELRSRRLVESLSSRFLLVAKADLEKVVGEAYVQSALEGKQADAANASVRASTVPHAAGVTQQPIQETPVVAAKISTPESPRLWYQTDVRLGCVHKLTGELDFIKGVLKKGVPEEDFLRLKQEHPGLEVFSITRGDSQLEGNVLAVGLRRSTRELARELAGIRHSISARRLKDLELEAKRQLKNPPLTENQKSQIQ